jgi:hypothetical protein
LNNVSATRVEVLIWVLIYGGMLVFCLGFALAHDGQGFGWIGVAGGALAVAAGAALVWVRSRMRDDPQP